jgi:hypothetical protein
MSYPTYRDLVKAQARRNATGPDGKVRMPKPYKATPTAQGCLMIMAMGAAASVLAVCQLRNNRNG